MSASPPIPEPLSPEEMRPVYELTCSELRALVAGDRDRSQASSAVLAHELRGTVAITATAVQIMTGVGSLVRRIDGEQLNNIATLNAMLGLPPAYRGAAHKQARDWMAFWANDGFHWQLMQWMEQALAEHRAGPVIEALFEFCEWQNALIALLAHASVEEQMEAFIEHWLAWES